MGARKSEFQKQFKGESQARYLERLFGAQGETPLEVLSHMFWSSDWEELRNDETLAEVVESLRKRESDIRELRLCVEALRDGSSAIHCARCRESFWGRADAKYCSPKCRVAAHRARAKQ